MKTILIFKRSTVKYYSQSKQRPVSGKDFSFIYSAQKNCKRSNPIGSETTLQRSPKTPPKTTDGYIMIHKSGVITVKE